MLPTFFPSHACARHWPLLEDQVTPLKTGAPAGLACGAAFLLAACESSGALEPPLYGIAPCHVRVHTLPAQSRALPPEQGSCAVLTCCYALDG